MHIPVLQKEVTKYLAPKPNENFVDATIGLEGHSKAILEKNKPNGKILGIEVDPEVLKVIRYQDRLIIVNDSYANLKKIVKKYGFKSIKGILFDLGMSSWHLEESGRGFSFRKNEPLDMRYNPQNKLTAEKIVNSWPEKEIERILKEYGEERFAKKISKEIVIQRKSITIKTTSQLVKIIEQATPLFYHRKKLHFAARTFQALRIVVNQELENLKQVLPQALEVLEKGGRIIIISFHSLEDRIVKIFFKENQKKGRLKMLNKKPITPSLEEVKKNSRARSAKLRAALRR